MGIKKIRHLPFSYENKAPQRAFIDVAEGLGSNPSIPYLGLILTETDSELGVLFTDRMPQGSGIRAYTDVLVASLRIECLAH